MNDFNLFTKPRHRGRRKGKRKPIKANVVMRVGGRRVSSAPTYKIPKYDFPVTIRKINPTEG